MFVEPVGILGFAAALLITTGILYLIAPHKKVDLLDAFFIFVLVLLVGSFTLSFTAGSIVDVGYEEGRYENPTKPQDCNPTDGPCIADRAAGFYIGLCLLTAFISWETAFAMKNISGSTPSGRGWWQ